MMKYRVRYAAAVVKELGNMSPDVSRRIRSEDQPPFGWLGGRCEAADELLAGIQAFRAWRLAVLFNIDGDMISIEAVSSSSQAY